MLADLARTEKTFLRWIDLYRYGIVWFSLFNPLSTLHSAVCLKAQQNHSVWGFYMRINRASSYYDTALGLFSSGEAESEAVQTPDRSLLLANPVSILRTTRQGQNMQIEINWPAVAIATFVGTAIAGVWYQEPVFGKAWRKATGVTPKQSKQAGSAPMATLLLVNFVTAVGLASLVYIGAHYFQDHSVGFVLLVGAAAGLTLSATALIVHNGFELKPKKLTLINVAYQLAIFLAMTLVIGLFGV